LRAYGGELLPMEIDTANPLRVRPNARKLSRIGPWNGQMVMIDAARLIVASSNRDIVFVFAGDDRVDPRYSRALRRRTRLHGIDTLCLHIGYYPDIPATLAAADIVAVPALEPPLIGCAAAEAQAMGRPAVVTTVGMLPENMLGPPRIPEYLRTGWLVRPGNVADLARCISAALNLRGTAYEALGARARQFAEFMFSPQSVAEAMRGVYTSLLACDA
jgi:glycosyltransferase involved in cell wall biosynthesis